MPLPLPDDNSADYALQDERTLALVAHLVGFAGLAVPFGNILGPLVVYLWQRDRSALVADHAREALNFQIWMLLVSALLVGIVVASVMTTETGFVAALALCGAAFLFWGGAMIVGAARGLEGAAFRYPLTVRVIRPKPTANPAAPGPVADG